MNAPISIIIPAYNAAPFIHDALESVCNQTVLPLEIVVVDDASNDGTGEIAKEYARTSRIPVSVIRMDRNSGGPYKPTNRAYPLTRGAFVAVLDADDLFERNAFASYMRMFSASSAGTIGIATSNFRCFDSHGLGEDFFSRHTQRLASLLADDDGDGVEISQSEAIKLLCEHFAFLPFKGMVRREAWEELDGVDESYRFAADCDFPWRLATRSSFTFRVTKEPLVRVRQSASSLSSNWKLMSTELIRLFRRMIRDVNDVALAKKLRNRLGNELYDLTYMSYKQRRLLTLFPAAVHLALFRLSSAVALP